MPQWQLLSLGLVLTALLQPTSSWKELLVQPSSCPQGCRNGNCMPSGKCECRFGWTGGACEVMALGACRSSDAAGAQPWTGASYLKSCECWQQQSLVFCDPPPDEQECHSPGTENWSLIQCYVRDGVPPERQFSDVPELTERVTWHRSRTPPSEGFEPLGEQPTEYLRFGNSWMDTDHVCLPLDKCPKRCSERGACLGRKPDPHAGHCLCHEGFMGTECEISSGRSCINRCGGKGICDGSLCRCSSGTFGLDCTRTREYVPDPSIPLEAADMAYARHRLRIYRYELPWNIAYPWQKDDGPSQYNDLYSAFERFYELFATDWEVRTENPYEANLFYIPVFTMHRHDNAGVTHNYIKRIVDYVKSTYPQFWARNGGRDHFMWLPSDLGACWLLDEPDVQAPIKIVHFGLQIPKVNYTIMPGRTYIQEKDVNPEYTCFKREKDIVTPCFIDDMFHEITSGEIIHQAVQKNETNPRKYLLYFGGGIREEQPEYSGGARQAFHKYLVASGNHPEIKYNGGHRMYLESTFCFVPYGDGWGDRLPHAMVAGCIPVIVQDFTHQPFDEVLPYDEFSVRMRVEDIPYMVDLLKAIPPEQVLAYQKAVTKYYQAMLWQPRYGGLAYNFTLQSLRRKLYNLWGYHLQT